VASLLLAAKLGYLKRELLYYANSGDTFGTPASVVGYAAIGMFERSSKPSGLLSEASGQALVKASREALERAIGKRDLPAATRLESYPELSRTTGAFVTLTKRGQLRGCVGRIETNEPLSKTVPMVAVEAALKDGRFPPVTAQELGELHVEVSVLTKPVKLKSLEELVPGRDGVVLEHQGRSGVFLPQVWTDTGWTRVEFLRQLASQKAGLPPDAWQQTALYVFQDQIFEEPRH
jgi:AmmeMemoRadiSam system protein A